MNEVNAKSPCVRRDLLSQASSNIKISAIGLLTNVLVIAVVFWNMGHNTTISVWILALCTIFFIRYYRAKSFLKNPNISPIDKAEKEFKTLTIITAVILSFGIILIFPYDKPLYQAFLTMIIAGLSAGAVMSLSIYKNLIRNYLIIFLTPYIFILYNQNSEIHTSISIMIFLFLILLTRLSYEYNNNLVSLIISKFIVEKTQKELQSSQDNFSSIFENTSSGILTYNNDLIVQESNNALNTVLKANRDEIINLDLKQLPDQNVRECLNAVLKAERGFYEGPYLTQISKLELLLRVETVPILGSDDKINGGLAIVTDITQKVKSEEKIHHQTHFDQLTGLANKLTLDAKIEEHLSKLSKANSHSAILFIDLDHFKTINESLGHHFGDDILKEFAQRALPILSKEDTFARLGRDEFVILLADINSEKESTENSSHKIAEKLHEVMKKPIDIEHNLLHITLSIGIKIIDWKENNIHDILKHANTAMHQAKKSGRNTTHFYEEEMTHHINEQFMLSNELHQALKLNQFELYYQPIVEMNSEDITSCEALIRWNHPKRGLIFPDQFITYAEENDLIINIGDWVIDTVCKQFKNINVNNIAINISYKQFIQKDFIDKIIQVTNINGIHPSALKLELTESVAINDLENTAKKMNLLKSHGFKIVMDDFGTGYSSLSYLKNLPFDFIKIDRSFIKDMLKNDDDASLVKIILAISKQYKFSIIAEGVETKEHIEFLKKLECDYYQGYVISKPIPIDNFKELLSASNNK